MVCFLVYGMVNLIINNVVTKTMLGGSFSSCDTTTLFIVFSITHHTIITLISSLCLLCGP